MTPLFSGTAPWAPRVLLITGLICLPLAGLLINETARQWQIDAHTQRAIGQLDARKATLQRLREDQRQRMKQIERLEIVPPAIAMMDRIAAAMQPDVILLAININPAQRETRLNVSASSLDALLALSERLQKLPARVVLESHRASEGKTPEWPITASLTIQFLQEPAHVQANPT